MEFCVKHFTTNYALRYGKHVQHRNDYGMGGAELFLANQHIFLLYFKGMVLYRLN